MKSLTILCVLALATQAFAGARLNVTANAPSRVIFDGEEVGQTPTTIDDAAPGFHEVRVENLATGEARIYDVYSPARATLQKDIAIQFQGAQAAAAPEAVAADAPDVDPDVAAEEEARRRNSAERNKVRTRNVLVGTALANELFNKGKSKKAVRGVSLGGAILNELIKR